MRKFLTNPYTWAILIAFGYPVLLYFVPTTNIKIVTTVVAIIASLLLMLSEKKTAGFILAVAMVLWVATVFVAYIRLSTFFPSLLEGGMIQ